jgi:integrase
MMAKSRCELMFERSCNKSPFTQRSYLSCIRKFMTFARVSKMEELLEGDQKSIQELVEDFVLSLDGTINPNSTPTQLAPIFLFYAMNDVILNTFKIKKMYPAKIKKQGFGAYSREQIKMMLSNTKKKRARALVLTFVSSGCRIGGLIGLKMKDIVDIPNSECKCLKIYHDDSEEYLAFLTPEAAKALYEYFEQRLSKGETFTDDTPVFARNENYVRDNAIKTAKVVNPMSHSAIGHGIEYMLASQQRTKDSGGRYKIPTTYGFRKYFNRSLKMGDNCNISIAEKLFGHSVQVKLDNHYLPIGMDELFREFQKAIPELTISEEERQLLKIKHLEKDRREEEDKTAEIKLLREQTEILKLRIERMELSKEQ